MRRLSFTIFGYEILQGNYPSEVLDKISALEKEYNTTLDDLRLLLHQVIRLDMGRRSIIICSNG